MRYDVMTRDGTVYENVQIVAESSDGSVTIQYKGAVVFIAPHEFEDMWEHEEKVEA